MTIIAFGFNVIINEPRPASRVGHKDYGDQHEANAQRPNEQSDLHKQFMRAAFREKPAIVITADLGTSTLRQTWRRNLLSK